MAARAGTGNRTFSSRLVFVVVVLCAHPVFFFAQPPHVAQKIDTYLEPYVQTGNFSGAVLVRQHGRTVFQKAYGFADRERQIRNTKATRFHVASVSMQFTAAALLRLVDEGAISLDTHVAEFAPGVVGGDKITIRDLLVERSGIPDINELTDYGDILQHHQTPATLVSKIEGRPLLFEPGSKFLHEEHSAYNLLALIAEKKTGVPFSGAVDRLVFRRAKLSSSGVDDDSMGSAANMANGYEPEGVKGLKRSTAIHWSAKTGNASVYATVGDEAKLVDALFLGQLLSKSAREALLDTSPRIGYGWFRGESKRFNETAYYMNGRAPGFASFVMYLPKEQTTVVVFSNIYSSATTGIGNDIAAIALGLKYAPFQAASQASKGEIKLCGGSFRFGTDFYQPNAMVTLVVNGPELSLRWPSADISALIPVGRDHFVDRAYWEEVEIERGPTGCPSALVYGHFRGNAADNPAQ